MSSGSMYKSYRTDTYHITHARVHTRAEARAHTHAQGGLHARTDVVHLVFKHQFALYTRCLFIFCLCVARHQIFIEMKQKRYPYQLKQEICPPIDRSQSINRLYNMSVKTHCLLERPVGSNTLLNYYYY